MTDEQTKPTMTPKDFVNDVLVVIAELTDFDPTSSVKMTATYTPVCERMGIDENLGGETSHGSLFTHRTIGLAMRSLRDRGLTKYAKKGYWCCTPAGIEEASQMTGRKIEHDKPETPPAPVPQAARTEATDETTADEEAEVLRLPVAAPSHPYSDDPYIRSLAIESVACFGAHSKRSEACTECPIAADCIEFVGVRKAQIATEIEAEEARAAELAKKREIEAAKKDKSVAELIEDFGNENDTDPGSDKKGKKGKYEVEAGHNVATARAQRETLCPRCDEKIAKKEQVIWVSHVGLFHPECVDTTNAKVGSR